MAIIVPLGVLLVAESIWVAKAYQIAPAAIIGTFDYSYLVFAVFWGFVFFSDVPDILTVPGIGLILTAGWLVRAGRLKNRGSAFVAIRQPTGFKTSVANVRRRFGRDT